MSLKLMCNSIRHTRHNLQPSQTHDLNDLLTALIVHPIKAKWVYRPIQIPVHSGFFSQQKLSQNDQEHGCVLTNASKLLLKTTL